MPFEQGLDNGCTVEGDRYRFFSGHPEFIICPPASGSFHGTQQGSFGVGTRRLCPFLVEHRAMRDLLSPFGESGRFPSFSFPSSGTSWQDYAPAGFQNLLPVTLNSIWSASPMTVVVKTSQSERTHSGEAAGNQVEHPFFHVAEALRLYSGGDDGMVVGYPLLSNTFSI